MLDSRAARGRVATALLALAMALQACSASAPERPAAPAKPTAPELRVGVTLDSPPFAMQRGMQMVGIEVDFAIKLAGRLDRPLRVVALEWSELIPALLGGRIDIIMSGMTVTRLRTLRIAFSEPYLEAGLSVLVPAGLADRYPTPQAVMASDLRLGVVRGTTAETYVREHYRGGQIFPYVSNGDAIADLLAARVDAFVTDAPIVAWFASEHEGQLVPLLRPLLTHDQIAWGFRPQDEALRQAANDALAEWKSDGTVNEIIDRWIPLWQAR